MPQSYSSKKKVQDSIHDDFVLGVYTCLFFICTSLEVSVASQDSIKAFTHNWITMLKIHVRMFHMRAVCILCSYCSGRLPVSMYGKVANFLEPSTLSYMLFLSHTTSLFMLIAVLFFFSRPHGSIIKIL